MHLYTLGVPALVATVRVLSSPPKPAPSCDKNVVLKMPADVKGCKAASKFIFDTSTGDRDLETDLRHYLNGASNRPPRRHRIQDAEGPVLNPGAKQIYFRRDLKVDPLRIESGPSWRVCFWSLHFVRCTEALQAATVG